MFVYVWMALVGPEAAIGYATGSQEIIVSSIARAGCILFAERGILIRIEGLADAEKFFDDFTICFG